MFPSVCCLFPNVSTDCTCLFYLLPIWFSPLSRLPSLHSEMVGLETLLGRDEEIDFCDYLNGKIDVLIPHVSIPTHTYTHIEHLGYIALFSFSIVA